MDKLMEMFDGLNLSGLIPDLGTVLGKLRTVSIVAVMAGPILLLALGLYYYFAPPREANYKAGFRTYYSMGSVEAWRFSQRLAGMTWTALGGVLTVVMGIICLTFGGKELDQLTHTAMVCVIWEAALVLVSYIALYILIAVTYDKDGNRRK